MQSGASAAAIPEEDEWDEDWEEDEYEESTGSFLSDMSVASKMKMAGGAAFVILPVSYTHLTLPTNREV